MRKLGWTRAASAKRQIGCVLAVATTLCTLAVAPAMGAAPGLTPFPASEGCLSARPAAPCKKSNGTAGGPIVLSPDGRFAYVASYPSNTLTAFALHGGKVSQVPGRGGCIAGEDGRPGCMHDEDLDEPNDLVLDPDGRRIYVANGDSNEVDVFDRDPVTGRLRSAPSALAAKVAGPNVLASSPDGRELYVATASGKVAVLDRDRETGAVHLVEEVEACVPGPHGCLAFVGFRIVVSADGNNVYLASVPRGVHNSGVEIVQGFSRNPVTGSLAPIAGRGGCATNIQAGPCQTVPHLEGSSMAISPDGKNLYLGTFAHGAIFTFDREPSGEIEAKRGKPVCLGERNRRGSCSPLSLANANGLAINADGHTVYATGQHSLVMLARRADGTLRVASRLKRPSFTAGEALALSPGGRVLYVSVAHPGGLRAFAVR
jgi:DNA-binding beta-propeller fold protein YncE